MNEKGDKLEQPHDEEPCDEVLPCDEPGISLEEEQEIRLGSDCDVLAGIPPKWRMHELVEPPKGLETGDGPAQMGQPGSGNGNPMNSLH